MWDIFLNIIGGFIVLLLIGWLVFAKSGQTTWRAISNIIPVKAVGVFIAFFLALWLLIKPSGDAAALPFWVVSGHASWFDGVKLALLLAIAAGGICKLQMYVGVTRWQCLGTIGIMASICVACLAIGGYFKTAEWDEISVALAALGAVFLAIPSWMTVSSQPVPPRV